jgi:MFS transporter, DHA3 family, macrolide efflux protein
MNSMILESILLQLYFPYTLPMNLGLLENRNYRLLVSGWGISAIGNGMQFIASSWLATELSGKGYAAALVLIAQTLPGLLLAPLLGVLIDRLERRRLAAFLDFFRAAGLMLVPLVYWFGNPQAWHLYAMTLIVALADSLYWATRGALVREVVPKDQLLEANTISMTTVQLGMILGASASGFIIAAASPVTVMLLNTGTYIISGILTLWMRVEVRQTNSNGSYLGDLRAGWDYLRQQPELWFPYFGGLMLFSTIQTINVLLVPFVKNVLGLEADALGLIDAAWAVGAVAAGFAMVGAVRRFGRERLMVLSPLLLALCLMAFSFSSTLLVALVLYALGGFLIRGNVLYRTTSQERTDLSYQGRVESIVGVVSSLMALIIFALMGLLQEFVSPRALYWVQSAVLLMLALWAWRVLFGRMARARA